MKIHNVEQGTDEWFDLRNKYPLTASEAQAIGNAGKGLETLVWNKLAERHSTAEKVRYSNVDTDRGNELEPQARSIYELETGNKVTEVGFVTNSKISKVGGASPDGLVGEDGLLEIKCLDDVSHFKLIVNGEKEINSKYLWQVQMQMLFTDRKWAIIFYYNPNFTKSTIQFKIGRDEEKIEKLRIGLSAGLKMIEEKENSYDNAGKETF